MKPGTAEITVEVLPTGYHVRVQHTELPGAAMLPLWTAVVHRLMAAGPHRTRVFAMGWRAGWATKVGGAYVVGALCGSAWQAWGTAIVRWLVGSGGT